MKGNNNNSIASNTSATNISNSNSNNQNLTGQSSTGKKPLPNGVKIKGLKNPKFFEENEFKTLQIVINLKVKR